MINFAGINPPKNFGELEWKPEQNPKDRPLQSFSTKQVFKYSD